MTSMGNYWFVVVIVAYKCNNNWRTLFAEHTSPLTSRMIVYLCLRASDMRPAVGWQALDLNELMRSKLSLILFGIFILFLYILFIFTYRLKTICIDWLKELQWRQRFKMTRTINFNDRQLILSHFQFVSLFFIKIPVTYKEVEVSYATPWYPFQKGLLEMASQ